MRAAVLAKGYRTTEAEALCFVDGVPGATRVAPSRGGGRWHQTAIASTVARHTGQAHKPSAH